VRNFTYSDQKSHKFWTIEQSGSRVTVTFGRVGGKGQTQTKEFKDEAAARKEHDKLVKEKLAKGYVETTAAAAATPPLRTALEDAIAADPDDLGAHMAYADWLAEQGDPRGEFIQVQLALEKPDLAAAERKRLQKREKQLLDAHARQWLGGLAPTLLDGQQPGLPGWQREDQHVDFAFARGWLDSLSVGCLTVQFARALARAPESRLLRRLVIEREANQLPWEGEPGDENAVAEEGYDPGRYTPGGDVPADEDFREGPGLFPLRRSPYLGNVRVFRLGELDESRDGYGGNCHTEGDAAADVVKKMPKIEELYLLAHNVDMNALFRLKTLDRLRVLQIDAQHDYPLELLAKNPSLGRLTHLLLYPHGLEPGDDEAYINIADLRAIARSPHLKGLTHLRLALTSAGDAGCEEIVKSGLLKRLKMLDLRFGIVTDDGARTLAACPDLKNLEPLDLRGNMLTQAGIGALKATKVHLLADQQKPRPDGEIDLSQYFYEGDPE
jgi:uncharacterized protein (TIGR02996 family)